MCAVEEVRTAVSSGAHQANSSRQKQCNGAIKNMAARQLIVPKLLKTWSVGIYITFKVMV